MVHKGNDIFLFFEYNAYFCNDIYRLKPNANMISFTVSLVALVIGYLIYGRVVERILGPDDRQTPAVAHPDGVDYITLPGWRIFMIQFLNIAGTGPIFGAIMGAWYGPSAYLWIVFGCIFAGAVHDFFVGMLSERHDGAGLPELVGVYLGGFARKVMLVFSVVLLLMVGVVFVFSPALILSSFGGTCLMWVGVIFVYYILATMLPIDKIIGKIYPVFAFSLLFMALALMAWLYVKMPALPEVWSDLSKCNLNADPAWLGVEAFEKVNPLYPCLFITIACGAISGFHATQSPLMARCMRSERQGRPIFYGAMITEGVVALIWATVSMYFFYYGGWREVVPTDVVQQFIAQYGEGGKTLVQYFSAPNVVNYVCTGWLGIVGGILAVLGVVAAPITSGDTAFRSARLIIAEALHLSQRPLRNRFAVCLPLFLVAIALLVWQIDSPNGFNVIWQYFGWANQTLSVFSLWTITVFLVGKRKAYGVTLVPAVFMTDICMTFLMVSPQAFGLPHTLGYVLGLTVTVAVLAWFCMWKRRISDTAKNVG